MTTDNTKRFSNRVNDYIKFRPTYPSKILNVLEKEIGLNEEKVIADIGSGTGISSLPFLENKNFVYGVEPNKEMREAQEQILKNFSKFRSIAGSAEQTTLKNNSIDIIFCGQAFHWFDKELSKIEFSRILKGNRNLVFAWNSRITKTDFQKDYEQLLSNKIVEYKNAKHRSIEDQVLANFFNPKMMKVQLLDNEQNFDLDGLKGRLKSSSYCPKEGSVYEDLLKEIENLFSKYQKDNSITFNYETKIYWC